MPVPPTRSSVSPADSPRDRSSSRSSRAARPQALEARDLADLAVAPDGQPCISLLMPTRPGPRMAPGDVARMRQLGDDVDMLLRAQHDPGRITMMRRLDVLMTRAAAQPADRGLAIYVNRDTERVFRLPLPVPTRSVVEPTFATRALFTVLHRMPPYVLLVVHPTCAHLYQGGDGTLRPVGERDVFRGTGAVRLPRQGEPSDDDAATEAVDTFLRGVDRMLGSYRAEHPSPLVLAGTPPLLDRFTEVSRHLQRLAGRVQPADERTPLDLASASAEVVTTYLASRRDEALARLRAALASRPGEVARGMADCWQQVHQRPPGLLLVEEGYVRPGRAGGAELLGRTEGGRPAVHDLVDDLMEVVILRGGQLALVTDGDLAAHGRVALISGPLDPPAAPGRRTPPG